MVIKNYGSYAINVKGVHCTSMGTPWPIELFDLTIAPLGYRKQTGLSSIQDAVATMLASSTSSEGAITIMFGKHDIKVISKAPQFVGPSEPTKPALEITNRTGIFCLSTS